MMNRKKDIVLEYMRVLACVGVVLIHVFKSAHDVFPELSAGIMFLCSALVNNLRWCVPVFLMITGALLLNPEKEMPLKKIGGYIWRVFVVLAVFGSGFALMELVFEEKTLSMSMIPKALVNMLAGRTWDHLWYLYTLIVLYCFLPLLRAAVAALKAGEMKFLLAMMVLYTIILPMIEAAGVEVGISLSVMSVHMLYMLLGYQIKSGALRIPGWAAAAGLAASTVFLVGMAYCEEISGMHVSGTLITHASIPVLVQSVSIFSLMLKVRPASGERINRAVLSVSQASFGIYILHMFYINLAYKVFDLNPGRLGVWLFVPVIAAVSLLTYFTVVLLRKIPVVRKYM